MKSSTTRSAVVAAVSFAAVLGASATASAEPAPRLPESQGQAEFGNMIGEGFNCRINYRTWGEIDPSRPHHLVYKIQAFGVDALGGGSSAPASCGQWLTVYWSAGYHDERDVLSAHKGERMVFVQSAGGPVEPITLDIDLSGLPTGKIVAQTKSGSLGAFAPWRHVEQPTVVGYNVP